MSKLRRSIDRLFGRNGKAVSALSDNGSKDTHNHPGKGTQILVIDDSKTAQKILNVIFSQAGYEVIQAYDAESGIALAQQHKPSLILMDVIMPGISGFQATRMIRKDPDIADIPIIVVSGDKQAGDKFWLSNIGADQYLTKPFTRSQLFTAVYKLLYSGVPEKNTKVDEFIEKAVEASNEVIEPDQSYKEKNLTVGNELKILVVDDSKTVQYQMKKILMQKGYEVLHAYDATSGIILAKKNNPALIIMDVVMPAMNGFQATRFIRKDKHIAEIPIVIISGNKLASEKFWATKMGANHYMSKPFSRCDMFAAIDKVLQVKSVNSSQGLNMIVEPDSHASYEEQEEHESDD